MCECECRLSRVDGQRFPGDRPAEQTSKVLAIPPSSHRILWFVPWSPGEAVGKIVGQGICSGQCNPSPDGCPLGEALQQFSVILLLISDGLRKSMSLTHSHSFLSFDIFIR